MNSIICSCENEVTAKQFSKEHLSIEKEDLSISMIENDSRLSMSVGLLDWMTAGREVTNDLIMK